MSKKKISPEDLNKFLCTNCPNRAERRKLEKLYKRQQKLIAQGKIKPRTIKVSKIQKTILFFKRIPYRILNFILRRK